MNVAIDEKDVERLAMANHGHGCATGDEQDVADCILRWDAAHQEVRSCFIKQARAKLRLAAALKVAGR